MVGLTFRKTFEKNSSPLSPALTSGTTAVARADAKFQRNQEYGNCDEAAVDKARVRWEEQGAPGRQYEGSAELNLPTFGFSSSVVNLAGSNQPA